VGPGRGHQVAESFDDIDHEVLLSVLREEIRDHRFLILVSNLLKAGYLEDWRYNKTHSGTPQGGVISPILANIHLDRLDKFVEGTLIPEFTRGKIRKTNPVYKRLFYRIRKLEKGGGTEEARELRKELRSHPTGDQHDPNYRRLRYVRYADDFLLGFAGPKDEAEEIKVRLKTFLGDHLKLELSEEKALITHASEMAGFLGYEVTIRRSDERPQLNGMPELRLPSKVLDKVCARSKRDGKPTHRTELIHDSDFDIVSRYGAEYRGIVQYYVLAHNGRWLGRLRWYMENSLLRTLARKHNTTIAKLARLSESRTVTPSGTMMKCWLMGRDW
jgi:Type II intron maturase/Reverse transcriptase (RNA-dependent DNA polymerase)